MWCWRKHEGCMFSVLLENGLNCNKILIMGCSHQCSGGFESIYISGYLIEIILPIYVTLSKATDAVIIPPTNQMTDSEEDADVRLCEEQNNNCCSDQSFSIYHEQKYPSEEETADQSYFFLVIKVIFFCPIIIIISSSDIIIIIITTTMTNPSEPSEASFNNIPLTVELFSTGTSDNEDAFNKAKLVPFLLDAC